MSDLFLDKLFFRVYNNAVMRLAKASRFFLGAFSFLYFWRLFMDTMKELFGCKVFNEKVMKERLPKETFNRFKKAIDEGERLDIETANVIANNMKAWAVENGATHFTHWFQPMTGITAEKHDSFISPTSDGSVIMEFSGKELVRGEPDASSFPSGGLRATFEARGYTAWDPTSYAFIKDDVLCIPTAFCSYGGEALDKKTPLLRSMEAINKQALRVVKLFGNTTVKSVKTTVGPEQEYFLIPKDLYDKRKDLIYTGRTLFGAKPPKGQEMEDHYFGTIPSKVQDFMKELNTELWKLGVLAKTEHNEVAPAQHELAPIFTTTNIATDHNQLTMEIMQKVAKKHGMVCLLAEKPFAGVNGSGKHNNWSITTDTGVNLLEPGNTPYDNAQFLLFLTAVIKAVDEYQDLLRISASCAGNDHRLGANEAPPAIVSMFLGDELTEILDAIEKDNKYTGKEKSLMKVGVHVIPKFPKDTTDRNRTSPFAFTGNKFEFRMVGSSMSIAEANIVLNTAVAEELKEFADVLENAKDFTSALHDLIKNTVKEHKRIIFNGNGYDDEWVKEAERRGLLNLKSTPDCAPYFLKDKNVKLFTEHKVFSETEMKARYEIMLENYVKTINIEAMTMIDMVNKDILPAISNYVYQLALTAEKRASVLAESKTGFENERIEKLSALASSVAKKTDELENALIEKPQSDSLAIAKYFRNVIFTQMNSIRVDVDMAESITSAKCWPYPSYGELLFGIR